MKRIFSKRDISKLKRLKRVFAVMISVMLFFAVFYDVFMMTEVKDEDVPDYGALKVDSYQEYKNYISNTKSGIKSLLESTQIEEINKYDDFFEDLEYEKEDNPFVNYFDL